MLDIAGSRSWSECARVLQPKGILIAVGVSSKHTVTRILGHLAVKRLGSIGSGRRMVFFIAKLNGPDLDLLRDLLESGQVRPVIDRQYLLDQASAALRHLQEGHAKGKIVLSGAAG